MAVTNLLRGASVDFTETDELLDRLGIAVGEYPAIPLPVEDFKISGNSIVAYKGTSKNIVFPKSYDLETSVEAVYGAGLTSEIPTSGNTYISSGHDTIVIAEADGTHSIQFQVAGTFSDWRYIYDILSGFEHPIVSVYDGDIRNLAKLCNYDGQGTSFLTFPFKINDVSTINDFNTFNQYCNSASSFGWYYFSSTLEISTPIEGNTYPITSIGLNLFRSNHDIESVIMLDNITNIGEYAFQSCDKLKYVSMKKISFFGNGVFSSCYNLKAVILDPDSTCRSLPYSFMDGCRSLEYFIPPKNLVSLESQALRGTKLTTLDFKTLCPNLRTFGSAACSLMKNLTSITFPDQTTTLRQYLLTGDSALTSIELPKSLSTIEAQIFENCTALTSISISAENTYFSTESGILYDKNKTTLKFYPANAPVITLPQSLTLIGTYAFSDNKNISALSIPEGVISLGDYAFRDSNINSINFPTTLTGFGNNLFNGCANLSTISVTQGNTTFHSDNNCIIRTDSCELVLGCKNSIIPTDNSVTSIAQYAFRNVSELKNIVIPDNITSIGTYAFDYCENLETLTLSNNLITIPTSMCRYCTKLSMVTPNGETPKLGVIMIPEGVVNINSNAFDSCQKLNSLILPSTLTSSGIGSSAFYNCQGLVEVINKSNITIAKNSSTGYAGYYAKIIVNKTEAETYTTRISTSANNISYYIYDTDYIALNYLGNDATITLDNGCTEIYKYSFYKCVDLTSVVIPEGVTTIGQSAFYDCNSIASITLPSTITSIGNSSFYGCSQLNSINIPASVVNIGGSSFRYCVNLSTIDLPSSITSMSSLAFGGCTGLSMVNIHFVSSSASITTASNAWFNSCSSSLILRIPSNVSDPASAYGNYWNYYDNTNILTYVADL